MSLLAVLAVLNIICLPIIFIVAILKRKLWLLVPFIIIQFAWIINGPNYLIYRAGGGFGPGTLINLTSVFLLLVSILIFLIGGGIAFINFKKAKRKIGWYLLYLIGAISLWFFMGIPLSIAGENSGQCNQLNQQEIEQLVNILNVYRTEHGEYPEDLEMLIPTYLPSLPTPHCFENYSKVGRPKGFGESAATNVGLPNFGYCP